MKGYFVLFNSHSWDDHSGVGLKIRNQIETFNKAGLNCSEIVLPYSDSKLLPVTYRLPYANTMPIWKKHQEFYDADYLYIRRPLIMNVHMRKVLSDAKKRNSKLKIIVEIPTYPYDDEYNTFKAKELLIIKDKYNRNRMRGIVDRFVILTDEKEIFGIPTLKIVNGINVDAVKERTPVSHEQNTIHMCAVAVFKEWHGYERLIEGVKNYYAQGGSRNIVCHFAGEGPELPLYKQLVEKYSLSDHFVFHGYQEGESLDQLYDLCSISLGSFGMYKINIDLSCNLKSREAVARGIPMVTGCRTDIFVPGQYKYFLEYPNDASILDIGKIIEFHDRIYQEGERTVIKAIRQYAYDHIGMDSAMRKVIDYIKGTPAKV